MLSTALALGGGLAHLLELPNKDEAVSPRLPDGSADLSRMGASRSSDFRRDWTHDRLVSDASSNEGSPSICADRNGLSDREPRSLLRIHASGESSDGELDRTTRKLGGAQAAMGVLTCSECVPLCRGTPVAHAFVLKPTKASGSAIGPTVVTPELV